MRHLQVDIPIHVTLLASGHYRMVFEHFQDYFHLKDLARGLFKCFNFVVISFNVTFHIKLHVSLKRLTF